MNLLHHDVLGALHRDLLRHQGEHHQQEGGADAQRAQGLQLVHHALRVQVDEEGLPVQVLVLGGLLHMLADFVFTQSC